MMLGVLRMIYSWRSFTAVRRVSWDNSWMHGMLARVPVDTDHARCKSCQAECGATEKMIIGTLSKTCFYPHLGATNWCKSLDMYSLSACRGLLVSQYCLYSWHFPHNIVIVPCKGYNCPISYAISVYPLSVDCIWPTKIPFLPPLVTSHVTVCFRSIAQRSMFWKWPQQLAWRTNVALCQIF
jgi:hypothetical protein